MKVVVVTGGLGFIGSNVINELKDFKIVIIDRLKFKKRYFRYISLKKNIIDLIDWKETDKIIKYLDNIECIIHLGAISNTLEKNKKKILEHNLNYSKKIFQIANRNKINFIYASSAAVYGNGKYGFRDFLKPKLQNKYKPLNPYANSKLNFDKFIYRNLKNANMGLLVGLRFFNVYGNNEFHKKNHSSPVFKFYQQIKKRKQIEVFDFFDKDIHIKRDFIYIDDVCLIIKNLMKKKIKTVLNIGSGNPVSFYLIAKKVANYSNLISFKIKKMPNFLGENYQTKTCSDNRLVKKYKLIKKFTTIEDGIKKYLMRLNFSK